MVDVEEIHTKKEFYSLEHQRITNTESNITGFIDYDFLKIPEFDVLQLAGHQIFIKNLNSKKKFHPSLKLNLPKKLKFMNYSNQELYFDQIEFIQNTLKKFSPGKRLIIFMHHPPFIDKKDILKMGSDRIHDRDISYWMFEEKIYTDFFNLFNNHNVEYIFTGHLHINLETKFNDTKIISTSAVGVPLGDDPSGYRIIDFENENLSYKFYEI